MLGFGLGDAIGAGVEVGVDAVTVGIGGDVTTAGLVVDLGVVAIAEPPHAARTNVRTLDARSRAERISWNSYESDVCRRRGASPPFQLTALEYGWALQGSVVVSQRMTELLGVRTRRGRPKA